MLMLVVVLLCAPFVWWYYVLYKHRSLNAVPGPKPIPIFGSAIAVGDTPQQFLDAFCKFRKQFGGVYKIYIANELRLVLSDPQLVEAVLSSNVHITKSNAYDLLKGWLGTGLLTSTGRKWKSRRKMITPTFHFKILDQFLDIFNECGNTLTEKLSKEVGKTSVDVYPYINLYSLDVICESSMGVKVASQEGENAEYVQAVRGFLDIFIVRTFSAWKKIEILFRMTEMHKFFEKYLKIMHQFSNSVIQRRREEKSQESSRPIHTDDGIKRKVALLDMLLESEDNARLSNEDIREEIDTFMFEGHDTTTSGIAFTMLALAENPDIQERVYEEIVSVVGEEQKITMQHIQEMKYLEMTLKEVQRIYPSVPVFERRVEEDSIIGGYNVPKGVLLSIFVFPMHRDENYFHEPEKFDPNRFLPENQAQRHNYCYVPFSAGPRNCIGQKFAMLEMKSVIIKIVKKFRILPVPNFKPELGFAAILKSYNGVCVRLQLRDSV